MTVVYVDTLFLLNLIVDYLLLLGAARLSGGVIRRLRLALGAVLGAAYAVAVFLPGLGFLTRPALKLAVAAAMSLAAFGGDRRLLRSFLSFLALACALGGGVLAMSLLGARGVGLERGVLSPNVDLGVLLLSAAVCYGAAALIFRRSAGHGTRELIPVVLTLEGRQVSLTALVDTGNTLTDPATGRGVMVVEGEKAAPLLERPLGEAELRDPVGTLAGLPGGRYRLIPYQAVGVECGLLLAVRLDRVRAGDRECAGMLAALSPTRLSDGGVYHALLGAMEESDWERKGTMGNGKKGTSGTGAAVAAFGPAGAVPAGKGHVHRGKRHPAAPSGAGRGGRRAAAAGAGGGGGQGDPH